MDDRLCIYEWKAWTGFLLPELAPRAARIRATIGDVWDDILAQVDTDCTLFAFHLNLTRTDRIPAGRARLIAALRQRGVAIVNAGIADISKREVQRACGAAALPCAAAPRAGDPSEWLIVKTDLNDAGGPERRLSPSDRERLDLPPLPPQPPAADDGAYRRLQRRDIDPEVWDSPDLIVERWIANARDIFFRVYVARAHIILCRAEDPACFKKMRGGIPRTAWFLDTARATIVHGTEPPPTHVIDAVARLRSVLRVDFGAIDVLEDERGRCYIIDVNTTPYWGGDGHANLASVTTFLASGLLASGD